MRSPFPSAAQAYAESIDSATASRHHPDARLTILPLPSLAALYPLDTHAPTSPPSHTSSSPAVHHLTHAADSTHRNSQVHLMHGNPHTLHPLQHSLQRPHTQQQNHHHHQQTQQQQHQQQQQPSYQSYDSRYQKTPMHGSALKPNSIPSMSLTPRQETLGSKGGRSHEFLGTSMESLLDAIEVHPALSATSSPSRSPSPSSPSSSPRNQGLSSPPHSASETDSIGSPGSHVAQTHATNNKGRMSISHILDNDSAADTRKGDAKKQQRSPKVKASSPKASSPPLSPTDPSKRKWSNLSSANFEEERNAKIRRSIQDHVSAQANRSPKMTAAKIDSSASSATNSDAQGGSSAVLSRQVFDSKDPSTRYQMTTICCLHASVAQKSYGSEKRFLCPPPIVQIQAPQDEHSNSGLSNKPQVTMSVLCDNGDGNNASNPPGQRSTLEDDHSGTFRYLYVTGTAKAKSFQLKLQVYGRACLPNGFVTSGDSGDEVQKSIVHAADLPEPYAVFDSAPITIISKPSKKTAKARNVSSCILAGSLVSLFNRINSQTVRTKYMSVQDGEFCAKNSNWSAFSITIVSNGPACPARMTSPKANQRSVLNSSSSSVSSSSPITYGAEIILTENSTGLQSDRLIVCKVENGRILEDATGPICQMQKVALQSLERNKDGGRVYLSAVGNDHQVGRYMDHSTTAKTVLRYQPSTMTDDHPTDIMKPGSDDFLCWTIVGISKFEYTYFESLPATEESKGGNREIPHPITPFPTLLKNPVYNAASHTLELVVSNFYSQLGNQPSQMPMNVWLGSRGPLTTHIIRRNTDAPATNGHGATESGPLDQTTLLVDLPQGKNMGVSPEETSVALPLLFVRNSDGITYNSRAKVVFTRPEGSDRWTVHMA